MTFFLKKRLLGDDETNKRFLGDGGTADKAAEMEDKRFSLTLALHSLSQWEHWEPTMGTFLIISAALLH